MRKKSYHHGNLKEDLLQIAFEFIKKNDIDVLTLKILSEITGTSRSAIYSHYGSKEVLIEDLFLHGFIQFDDYLSPDLQNTGKPLLDRIEQASRKYIHFARENKVLYRLLFGHKYAHVRREIMLKNDPNRSGFGALQSVLEEGQEKGILRIDNSYKQTVIVWSALHGLTSLVIDGFVGVEEMYDELFESMFQGILSSLLSVTQS